MAILKFYNFSLAQWLLLHLPFSPSAQKFCLRLLRQAIASFPDQALPCQGHLQVPHLFYLVLLLAAVLDILAQTSATPIPPTSTMICSLL
jgi:hypothetical protein